MMQSRVLAYSTILLIAWGTAAYAAQPQGNTPKPTGKDKSGQTTNDSSVVKLGEMVVTCPGDGSSASGYRNCKGNLGPLGSASLKDMPYSLNVTSGELIENRNAHNATDALKTLPTVAPLMSAGGYSSMHRVMVRGFSASDQSDLRDGLCDRSFTLQPMEDLERIEVLNGASGFLYGFSSIGGTVNYVSRKPPAAPLASVSVGQYSKGIRFGHADLGGPIGNDQLAYRLNVYGEDGDGYIDDSDQTRGFMSGALRYELAPDTCLTAAFYVQRLDMKGLQTYFDNSGIGSKVPDAFDPTRQYGQSWTRNESEKGVFDIGLDSKLSETFTLRTAYRRGEMWREYRYVGAMLLNEEGDYTEKFVDSPKQDESTSAAYALMDAHFDTLNIKHTLTFGYTHWGFTFDRGADFTAQLGPSSVDAPVAYAVPGDSGEQNTSNEQAVHNILLGERAVFSPAWSAVAGLNYAMYTKRTGQANPWGDTYSPRDSQEQLTPSVGLVYKPVPELSTYASYMQGLANGGSAPSAAANSGEVLDPSVSDQYEVGAKATIAKVMDLSAALFRIDKINEYVDPADNRFKQDGRQVHQGLELLVSGKVTTDLTLVGGYTWLDAAIDKAANNTKLEGEQPINVPDQQARLYLEYRLPEMPWVPGLFTASAGASYYGERPVNIPNTEDIPAVTIFDAGLRYQPGNSLTLNVNVSNIFDERYWSYFREGGDGLLLGDPLQVAFSAKYAF